MDPEDNLELAKHLNKRPKGAPEEAALRGACGRAYYAAFGVVRDLLASAKFPVPRRGAHQRILDLLRRSKEKDVLVAAGLFQQLRTRREEADYDVGLSTTTPFSVRESERAILLSFQITQTLREAAKKDQQLHIPGNN